MHNLVVSHPSAACLDYDHVLPRLRSKQRHLVTHLIKSFACMNAPHAQGGTWGTPCSHMTNAFKLRVKAIKEEVQRTQARCRHRHKALASVM